MRQEDTDDAQLQSGGPYESALFDVVERDGLRVDVEGKWDGCRCGPLSFTATRWTGLRRQAHNIRHGDDACVEWSESLTRVSKK